MIEMIDFFTQIKKSVTEFYMKVKCDHRGKLVNVIGSRFVGKRQLSIVNREQMTEMIDFFTQIKKVRKGLLYVNGSPFLGKRQLITVSRERMIEMIDFFTQIKKSVTEFYM